MTRITRATLDAYAKRASMDLDLPVDDVWVEHSTTGYAIRKRQGPGAHELDACLTAKEALTFLRGLSTGAQIAALSLP